MISAGLVEGVGDHLAAEEAVSELLTKTSTPPLFTEKRCCCGESRPVFWSHH